MTLNWTAMLTPRQRRVLDLAREDAGVNLPDLLEMIAFLSDLLDAAQPGPVPAPARSVLAVPYHSQHEHDAKLTRRDCGPACVEMVGEYYKPLLAGDVTTNDIMRFLTGGADRSTYIGELQRASDRFYGVKLERHDEASWDDLKGWVVTLGRPCIVLIRYGSFVTRMDRRFISGHYLVVIGVDEIDYQGETIERVIIHDPDFYGAYIPQGAFISVVRSHFMAMWQDAAKQGNPARMALVPQV